LDESQLQQIPMQLIQKLKKAAELLNEELCLEVAGMISDHDQVLSRQLRQMIENLQYKELLAILDNALLRKSP